MHTLGSTAGQANLLGQFQTSDTAFKETKMNGIRRKTTKGDSWPPYACAYTFVYTHTYTHENRHECIYVLTK